MSARGRQPHTPPRVEEKDAAAYWETRASIRALKRMPEEPALSAVESVADEPVDTTPKRLERTRPKRPARSRGSESALRAVLDADAEALRSHDEAIGARTELGNAMLFAAEHAGALRHVRARKTWIAWDGRRWRRDETGDADRAAKATVDALLDRALKADDEKAIKWAIASRREQSLRATLTLAATEAALALEADALDRDAWLLTCANGTLDLRTGILGPHDPANLITMATDVSYDPSAACPRWLRFLSEVFGGDHDLIAFVQGFVGYCLTGDTREHILVVLHGAGRNGKSVFTKTIQRLLGDHATVATTDTFLRSRNDRGPRNDLARLHRARLVTAAESGDGHRLDEATVKELTGGDKIAARFLFSENFEFEPRFKLVITTNHRPKVDGEDDAIWARLRLVPFEVCFEGREDKTLAGKLEAELPGILAWAVQGCMRWQKTGLGHAAAITRATEGYRQDEDVLGAFLDERCILEGEIKPVELRASYEAYCEEIGEKPLAGNVLGKKLARRGIERHKRAGVYRGIRLQ